MLFLQCTVLLTPPSKCIIQHLKAPFSTSCLTDVCKYFQLQGTPYPDQEQKAIDCVIQFAVHHLKFEISDIILFGWSIGGYVSSYAASRYQDFNATVSNFKFYKIFTRKT